jgi:hypothetical protein
VGSCDEREWILVDAKQKQETTDAKMWSCKCRCCFRASRMPSKALNNRGTETSLLSDMTSALTGCKAIKNPLSSQKRPEKWKKLNSLVWKRIGEAFGPFDRFQVRGARPVMYEKRRDECRRAQSRWPTVF